MPSTASAQPVSDARSASTNVRRSSASGSERCGRSAARTSSERPAERSEPRTAYPAARRSSAMRLAMKPVMPVRRMVRLMRPPELKSSTQLLHGQPVSNSGERRQARLQRTVPAGVATRPLWVGHRSGRQSPRDHLRLDLGVRRRGNVPRTFHDFRSGLQSPRDDLRLDLGGTLEETEDARVAENAADRVFQRETVPAVDLEAVVGRSPGDTCTEKLRHPRLEVAAPPLVL